MVANGLRDAGFSYINLDDCWCVNRTAAGVLFADPVAFPPSKPEANDGIKIVADYIHARQMKFGIYTARGNRTCSGRPGSDSHEAIDAQTFANWGVDYLKVDSCGGVTHGTAWEQYSRMRDALNATGRPIYYSITQALPFNDGSDRLKMHCKYPHIWREPMAYTTIPWTAEGKDVGTLANSFLVEYCNNEDRFGFTGGVPMVGGFLSQVDAQALLTYDNLTRSGAYNDADMLEVCNGGQSVAEYRAQFSTFAILTSPMILGSDVRNLSHDCASVVLSKQSAHLLS
jgi:alpha-galactosidase